MAKLSFVLNTKRPTISGRYLVQLRITSNCTNTTISCNISIKQSDFIGEPEKVVSKNCANAKDINKSLRDMYYEYINAIHELERLGLLQAMSAVDIKQYVERSKEYHAECTFSSCFEDYKQLCRTGKTKQTFEYTMQMIKRFCGKDKLFFADVDYKFLTDFDRWMEQNNIGMSSRGIVFRNIRTVYNYAINNDWVNQNMYPFRKFKIRQKQKEIVYLPEDKMRALIGLDLSKEQGVEGLSMARDFFMLSFYFCGINPIDLFNLPLQDGKISFVRTKVQFHEPAPIHIGIQQEAQTIINKYAGVEHLVNFAEKYASFESFYHFVKHRLKKLGEMIDCKEITFYWARYSWATYASKLDVSDSTISKALGHSVSTLAEKKYISFDWAKVDKANRYVIDYALYNKQ